MKFYLIFGILIGNVFSAQLSDSESFSALLKGDMKNAIPYLTKSCNNGTGPLSCDALAGCYRNGNGIEKDANKAIKLYQSACEKNYGPSCYALASMYINGEGVNVDYTYAGQLFEKSCVQEFPPACQIVEKIKKINQDNAQ
ncbi:MAG: tetratricopeptide repeat protein [Sulfuricurvum sp.]|nr:tetratricopeptide repeat protein [Sulfuricurvum sp.]